jgi:glycosyltransferase involved in cell wall biosynthesis
MRSKILVIVYNIERAREHEWLIRFMDPSRYEFEFVLINKPGSFLQKFLTENRIRTHNINYSGKVAMPLLVWKLFKLIRQGKFHLVHAHLFEATLGGMIAARLAGVKARLITRHNSDFHHRYFPSAVKYDRLAARLATHIVAVSDTVKHVLTNMEQVNESKISVIHHGIDFSEFELTPERSRKVEQLRFKYNIPANKKVVGVVSRFIHWKGVQNIIPAFQKVLEHIPMHYWFWQTP